MPLTPMTTNFPPNIHILADFFGGLFMDDLDHMSEVLRTAAKVAGATVLDIKLHHFGENGGVTGVAVLAESHISIHTWPENDLVAIDIFMCGASDPEKALQYLQQTLQPKEVNISRVKRGQRNQLSHPSR